MMTNGTVMLDVKIESYTAFEPLQSEWNDLLKRSVSDTPFGSYEYNKVWWDAYQPGELWILAFRDTDNRLIGLAPMFIQDEEGERILKFVGSHDVTDYLDVLFDKEHCHKIYPVLLEVLCSNTERFHSLVLDNLPAASPTYSTLPKLLSSKGFRVTSEVQEVCPLILLPDNFDDFLKLLDKKNRKELERKLRIAEGLDSVSWYIVDKSHDIDAEAEKFMSLMAKSHPEKAKFLENPQHVAFFKALVPAAMEAGWLQLNFLEVAGEAVAAYCNFDYNNEILVYNSGLDPSKASALSPGIVLLAYNIEHAIKTGRKVFNFLRGSEQYKYRMGATDTEIFNVKASLN
jgi:CelD/BcsL family acetyltransferase involved in cellulose biosynthesis